MTCGSHTPDIAGAICPRSNIAMSESPGELVRFVVSQTKVFTLWYVVWRSKFFSFDCGADSDLLELQRRDSCNLIQIFGSGDSGALYYAKVYRLFLEKEQKLSFPSEPKFRLCRRCKTAHEVRLHHCEEER
jgi:hypothetical protein